MLYSSQIAAPWSLSSFRVYLHPTWLLNGFSQPKEQEEFIFKQRELRLVVLGKYWIASHEKYLTSTALPNNTHRSWYFGDKFGYEVNTLKKIFWSN